MQKRQREPAEYLLGGLFFLTVGIFTFWAGVKSPGWFGIALGTLVILGGIGYAVVGLVGVGVRSGQS